MEVELAALAAAGATALVAAMATDAWQGIRDAVAGLFHRVFPRRRAAIEAHLDSRDARKGPRRMLTDDLTALAADGGQALVDVMPTQQWPPLRDHALQLFGYAGPRRHAFIEDLLDENAAALRDTAPDQRDEVRRQLAAGWCRQLTRLLAERPDAEGDLRGLVAQLRDALPAERTQRTYRQTNTARDNATVFAVQDGNLTYHPPGSAGQDGTGQDGTEQP